jgi:hypothetical protein
MVCVDDRGNYILATTLPLAVVGYVTAWMSRTAWLYIAVYVELLVQVAYGMLAMTFPSVWQVDFGRTMFLTMAGILGAVVALIVLAATIVLLIVSLIFLSPVVYQNVEAVTQWTRTHVSSDLPDWVGIALTIAICVGALLVVYLSRAIPALKRVLRVVLTSVALWMCVNMARLEWGHSYAYPDDGLLGAHANHLQLCCFVPAASVVTTARIENGTHIVYDSVVGAPSEPLDRCPFDLTTSWVSIVTLVALLLLSIYASYKLRKVRCAYCRCCCRRRKKTEKKRDGKPYVEVLHSSSSDDDDEDEDGQPPRVVPRVRAS